MLHLHINKYFILLIPKMHQKKFKSSWVVELALWVKELASKPGSLSPIPGAHVMEGEN